MPNNQKSKNKEKKLEKVPYDTKWVHISLNEKKALYFEAETPIQKIMETCQDFLNREFPEKKVNYFEKNSQKRYFLILYRNLRTSFNGWVVYYKKQNDLGDWEYTTIDEKINYVEQMNKEKNRHLLKRKMEWRQKSLPNTPLKIGPVPTTQFLVQTLNSEIHLPKTTKYNNLKAQNLVQTYAKIKTQWSEEQTKEFFIKVNEIKKRPEKSKEISSDEIYKLLHQDVFEIKGWSVKFLD